MRGVLVAVGGLAVVVLLGLWVAERHPAEAPLRGAVDTSRPRPQGDYYVVAVGAEPRHLNPFTAASAVPASVLSYTHDALMETDPHSGDPALSLAESVEAGADGRTFEVSLREGVRFSDGEELTMEDVMFTWELARSEVDLPGAMWSGLDLLESVENLDSRRLRLVLKERHFAGLGAAGKAYLVLQKKYFVDRVRAVAEREGKPVPSGPEDPAFVRYLLDLELPGPGTGPYQLGRAESTGRLLWNRGVDLLLTPNPYSWRREEYPELWNLAGIKLVFESDPTARVPLLRRQEIDWLPVRDASAMLRDDPVLAESYDPYEYSWRTLGPVFVIWNHRNPALADVRVRRALTMLFDRDALIAQRGVLAQPAGSWFVPGSPRAGDAVPLPHDVEEARALLKAAGWGPGGKPLVLTIVTMADREWEEIVDLAKPEFARAGVTLRKEPLDISLLAGRLKEGDFDGLVYAWNPDVFNDPTEIFHSTKADNNWMGYASDDMDEVLEQARQELDRDKRIALYHRFNEIFERDQPVTLLYHRRVSALLHKRFHGVEVGALGLNPRGWWVEPDEQRYR